MHIRVAASATEIAELPCDTRQAAEAAKDANVDLRHPISQKLAANLPVLATEVIQHWIKRDL